MENYWENPPFSPSLRVEHIARGTFLHHSLYIQNILKDFLINAAHLLSSLMVERSLDLKKDDFRPCDKGK